MIVRTSRYKDIEIATLTAPDGREYRYLRRRFIPSDAGTVVLAEFVVTRGDRLDNITARYLGDPEQFWRVCDANRAMQPEDLETVGTRLQIPLPQKG
jgi:hypothetical protein